MRIAIANLRDFGRPAAAAQRADVIQVVRDLDADVYVLGEVCGASQDAALSCLDELAVAVGRQCRLGGQPALSCGADGYGVAVLWRRGLAATRLADHGQGRWRMVVAEIDLGSGQPWAIGSYHGPPFDLDRRVDLARRIQSIMTRTHTGPGLVCGDFNDIGAAMIDDEYYDPDFAADRPWHPDFIHRCQRWTDRDGRLRHHADRRAGQMLEWGGLPDGAAHLRLPWAPTEGHQPNREGYAPRRLIRAHVKTSTLPALRGIGVVDTSLARATLDHLPVVVEVEPAAPAVAPAGTRT